MSWGQASPDPGAVNAKYSATIAGDVGSRSYVPSLFGGQPIAIDVGQPSVSSSAAAPPVGVVDAAAQDSGAVEPWAPYVRNPAQHYLLYGLSASGTLELDGASAGVPATSSWFSTITPYAGLLGRTRTGFYALQYAPSIVPYDTQTNGVSAYHSLSLDAAGDFTRRLRWSLDLRSGYGGELGRLSGNLTPQRVTAGVPIADPAYASLQPFSGNSLDSSARVGLLYQLTPRQTVGVSVSDDYSTFLYDAAVLPAAKVHNDMATLGLTFDRTLSERATLRVYASDGRIFSNVSPCNSFSGGLGLLLQPARSVAVDVGAGPSSGCGAQAANFHGTVSFAPRKSVQLYVSGSRQLETLYRLNSRWEDDVVAGADRRFRNADLGFDAGYYHGQSLGLNAPSQGYFVSPRIDYGLHLSRFTKIGFAYRRFHGSAPTGGGRDVSFALVTVSFLPSPVPLEK